MVESLSCNGRCTGREIWEKKLVITGKGKMKKVVDDRESILPYPTDEDGYILCPFCKKILGDYQLSTCPDCGKEYKGYKPYPKFHFPCPECE